MGRYRKLPVEIEAVCWTGDNAAEVADFMRSSPIFSSDGHGRAWVDISTLEGVIRADRGDWIVRGVQNEYYPVKPEIFAVTYEAVD
jgi:hypothetical protein